MWSKLLKELENINEITVINSIPHRFENDAASWTVKECLDWINDENQSPITAGLYPIYGVFNSHSYEEDCRFLLVKPSTQEFFEISGSHCSCYGFEGQFEPSLCPIEYLAKGKPWVDAYETVLEVVKYFDSIKEHSN